MRKRRLLKQKWAKREFLYIGCVVDILIIAKTTEKLIDRFKSIYEFERDIREL